MVRDRSASSDATTTIAKNCNGEGKEEAYVLAEEV